MCKLSVELLSYYIKYKKGYDDLKEYYDKTLKEAEQEHLYSLKAVRYDGVKVDGGQHTNIADKIAIYEEWRKKQISIANIGLICKTIRRLTHTTT
mgnify:CR=1 FL=1